MTGQPIAADRAAGRRGDGQAMPDNSGARGDARGMTLALLAARDGHATVCPSEVARALAGAAGGAGMSGGVDWRGEMAAVHAAVDGLVADGVVRLSWKGVAMPVRGGPYRIGRAIKDT